ncbi:hypothetical protein [Acinetobacter sp. P8-3-8]|uniref:hypothetical protein n=1 Tax=Acinetobacter sp. P8-3-8 TaxID=1029823 RepID=UPI0002485D83|nr:hypothetical protein [Acinetobacter sp. P8-3-8]
MKFLSQQKIQPDWWSKTFAGLVLGLSFAIACAALITLCGFQYLEKGLAPQFGLWSIPWIWLPIFFLAYFIPKGWQAILIYCGLNFIAYSLVFCLRG